MKKLLLVLTISATLPFTFKLANANSKTKPSQIKQSSKIKPKLSCYSGEACPSGNASECSHWMAWCIDDCCIW